MARSVTYAGVPHPRRRPRRRTSRSGALRRLPVTTLLLLQYLPLVIVPAIRFGTPGSVHTLSIIALGIGTAALVEANFAKFRLRISTPRPTPPAAAVGILYGGLVAQAASAYFGAGVYATQIGTSSRSAIAALFTPFQVWTVIGLGLVVYGAKEGTMRVRRAVQVCALGLLIQLMLGVYIGRLAPAMQAGLIAAFLFWMTELVRLRWVLIGVLVAALIWPVVFSLRNEQRIASGGQAAEIGLHDPGERLRLDLNLALVDDLRHRPEAPHPLTLLRFGLTPRVLDSGRGELSSSSRLNEALGGTTTSSASLTLFGNVYAYTGLPGVVLYAAAISLVVGVAARKRSRWWAAALAVLVHYLIWIEATFPDSLAAVLQAGSGFIAAWALAQVIRALREAHKRRPASPSPQIHLPLKRTAGLMPNPISPP